MERFKRYIEREYRKKAFKISEDCIPHEDLCDYAYGALSSEKRKKIESHLSRCYHCLDSIVAMHDAAKISRKRDLSFRKEYLFLLLTILCFTLSFILSRYFLQFLAATVLFGIKWIIDSKTTKTLIMINEAWKKERQETDGPPCRQSGRPPKDASNRVRKDF